MAQTKASSINDLTIVADIGARYGIHPSWRDFQAPLKYLAFEPDSKEADRLRGIYESCPDFHYEVIDAALSNEQCERDFYLLKHRGLSSFLKPDLQSECFRHLKPGQAKIEKVLRLKTERLDDICATMNLVPDFLKVDTEGTEQEVLEGGAWLLEHGVLGVRSSCNFQPCFVDQKLFSQTHDYLLERGFMLLNLDYKGYGYPRLGLFRKPDPIESEDFRYGVLVAADAVWTLRPERVTELCETVQERQIKILKLSHFCMMNNAPDYGIDLLREEFTSDEAGGDIANTRLYKTLRLQVAQFLGRWRTVPDDQWEKVKDLFEDIFRLELKGGSEFYPQMALLSAESKDLGPA